MPHFSLESGSSSLGTPSNRPRFGAFAADVDGDIEVLYLRPLPIQGN